MTTSIPIPLFPVFGASPNTAIKPCVKCLVTPSADTKKKFKAARFCGLLLLQVLASYLCFSQTELITSTISITAGQLCKGCAPNETPELCGVLKVVRLKQPHNFHYGPERMWIKKYEDTQALLRRRECESNVQLNTTECCFEFCAVSNIFEFCN